MKLNNKGWGLTTFLGFVLIFVLAIIIVSINAYKVSYIVDNNENNIQFSDNQNKTNFINVENNLVNSAKNYIEKENISIETDGSYFISSALLISNNYISSLNTSNGIKCSGYVIASNSNSNIIYKGYIKCGNSYQTTGYSAENEK